jgi:DNA-binding beta-propeller fold protein YncE
MNTEHGPSSLGHVCRAVGAGLLVVLSAAVVSGCGSPQRSGAGAGANLEYSFWPPPPNEPRIQYLTAFSLSSDVEPPQSGFDKLVFGTDRKILPIGKPYGVAFWRGRVYVCDIVNPNVVILDLEQRETRLMFTRRGEPMRQPTDIAIAPDGMKYVVDRRVGRIFVYVPDFETQSVLVLDRHTGTTLRSIGEAGGGPGQFIRPLGIDVDQEGNVYVTDAIRGRLQKFAPDGELIFIQGDISDAPGDFVRPKHVAVDRDGVIYVVDAAFQNVQMFNTDGELLMFFGSPGSHLGSMSLPAGVAVYDADMDLFEEYAHPAFESKRIVLVTNQFGLHKVAVYALGNLRQGATIDDITPDAATVNTGLQEGEFKAGLIQGEVAPEPTPDEDAQPEVEPDTDSE